MAYILLLSMATLYAGIGTTGYLWLAHIPPFLAIFILSQVYLSYRLHRVQRQRALEIEENVRRLLEGEWLWWEHFYTERVRNREVPSLVRSASYFIPLALSIFVSLAVSIYEAILSEGIAPKLASYLPIVGSLAVSITALGLGIWISKRLRAVSKE